jgi:alanine-glyoxylate transaminase/serine-glyoxylate transaminase/serine-pyruvate transaminase
LREALAIVLEEGLAERVARHEAMHRRLRAGLEAMGLGYVPRNSLHTLNCVGIPAGADDGTVRRRLLEEYGIEIGSGLGVMTGKAWRIGLMEATVPRCATWISCWPRSRRSSWWRPCPSRRFIGRPRCCRGIGG